MSSTSTIIFLIHQLADELNKDGEASFRRNHPTPFLVVKNYPTSGEEFLNPKTVITPSLDDGDTGEIDQVDTNFIPNVTSIPLMKSPRNAYASKITVGRARNNDIIIRDAKVSKLHSAFVKEPDGRFTLVDMGSANGTFHNSVRLVQNKPAVLRSGDRVSFYQYEFEFTELGDLVQRLRRIGPSPD